MKFANFREFVTCVKYVFTLNESATAGVVECHARPMRLKSLLDRNAYDILVSWYSTGKFCTVRTELRKY